MGIFAAEFDRGEYQSDNYEVIECEVEYNISPYDPGIYTFSNGDPGYPPSGGEVEDLTVFDMDGKDITNEVPSKWLDIFTEMAYKDAEKQSSWD